MAEKQAAPVDWASFNRLRREHSRLREDLIRLIDCLGHGHTFSQISWQCHREKFRATCLRSPLYPIKTSLADAMTIKPLRLVQRLCGGRKEMLSLRETATRAKACADSIFTGYDVCLCSGLDTQGEKWIVDCFHLEDQAWELLPLPQAPVNPVGCAGAVLGGSFYICGGKSGRAAWRFDLKQRSWVQLAHMNKRRYGPIAAIAGGRLYLCGGEDAVENVVHDSVEFFDVSVSSPSDPCKQGVWCLLPASMSEQRRCFSAVAIPGAGGQDLFVCGGTAIPTLLATARQFVAHDSAEVLEFGGQGPRLRHLPPMLVPRWAHVSANLRGQVFACGGASGKRVSICRVDCFSLASETWSSSPPMGLKRFESSAVVMAGCLYMLGGACYRDLDIIEEHRVERFDPVTGTWEILPWELLDHRSLYCAGPVWRGELKD